MSNDVLPGLRAALVLARHQYALHHRQSLTDENPEQYEDAVSAMAAGRIVERIESAIAEASRAPESCSTRTALSWEQVQELRKAGAL